MLKIVKGNEEKQKAKKNQQKKTGKMMETKTTLLDTHIRIPLNLFY